MEETELFQKYFPDKTIGIDDNPYKYNKCTVWLFHHPKSIKFCLNIPTNTVNTTTNTSTTSSNQTTSPPNTTYAKNQKLSFFDQTKVKVDS